MLQVLLLSVRQRRIQREASQGDSESRARGGELRQQDRHVLQDPLPCSVRSVQHILLVLLLVLRGGGRFLRVLKTNKLPRTKLNWMTLRADDSLRAFLVCCGSCVKTLMSAKLDCMTLRPGKQDVWLMHLGYSAVATD